MNTRRTHARAVTAVALAIVAIAAPGHADEPAEDLRAALAEGQTISLDELEAAAVTNAPAMAGADASIGVAEQTVDAGRLGRWPLVQLEASVRRIGGFEDNAIGPPGEAAEIETLRTQTTASAVVEASIFDIGPRLSASLRAAAQDVDTQRATREATARAIRFEVEAGWWQYARARGSVVLAERSVARAEADQDRVAALREVGMATESNVLEAAAGLANAELQRIRSLSAVQSTQDDLELRTGVAAPANGWSIVLPPDRALTESTAEAVATALAERPEFDAIDASLRANGHLVRENRWALAPTVAPFAGFEVGRPLPYVVPPRDTFETAWQVGIAVRWSPNQHVTTRAQGQIIDASAEVLEAERRRVALAIEREVIEAHARLRIATEALPAAEALVRASRAAYEARVAEVELGAAVAADLAAARDALAVAEQHLLVARIEVAAAWSAYDFVVGR